MQLRTQYGTLAISCGDKIKINVALLTMESIKLSLPLVKGSERLYLLLYQHCCYFIIVVVLLSYQTKTPLRTAWKIITRRPMTDDSRTNRALEGTKATKQRHSGDAPKYVGVRSLASKISLLPACCRLKHGANQCAPYGRRCCGIVISFRN